MPAHKREPLPYILCGAKYKFARSVNDGAFRYSRHRTFLVIGVREKYGEVLVALNGPLRNFLGIPVRAATFKLGNYTYCRWLPLDFVKENCAELET